MLVRLCLENRTGSVMAAPAHPAEEHPLYDGARWHDRPCSFVTESLSRKHDKLLCSITVTRLRNRCDDQLKLDERQRRLESLLCAVLWRGHTVPQIIQVQSYPPQSQNHIFLPKLLLHLDPVTFVTLILVNINKDYVIYAYFVRSIESFACDYKLVACD